MNSQETFASILEKKIHEEKQETLRSLFKKLEAKGSKISLIKLSKIIRGIQCPNNKQEFDDLMEVLDIHEPEKSKLEKLANNFIPVKKLSEQEIMQKMPVLIGKKFKTPEELDQFIDFFRDTIRKDQEPEP